MMYSVGEKLIYSSLGVYRIIDIRQENVLGTLRTYYVMCEIGEAEASLVYVPTDSDAERTLLKPLISKSEAEALIAAYSEIEPLAWSDATRARQLSHKAVLDGSDRYALAALIKSIDEKQKERIKNGRKPFLTDEHTRERAAKLFLGELCTVLDKTEPEILSML